MRFSVLKVDINVRKKGNPSKTKGPWVVDVSMAIRDICTGHDCFFAGICAPNNLARNSASSLPGELAACLARYTLAGKSKTINPSFSSSPLRMLIRSFGKSSSVQVFDQLSFTLSQ